MFIHRYFTNDVFSADCLFGRAEDDQTITREQRHQDRQARKAEWEALSEEEKQARRSERQARYEGMSDAEKKAMKQRRKQHGMRGSRAQRGDGSGQRGRRRPAPQGA